MNIGAIITATVVVAAVGLFIGIFLSIAGKKFAVFDLVGFLIDGTGQKNREYV